MQDVVVPALLAAAVLGRVFHHLIVLVLLDLGMGLGRMVRQRRRLGCQ